MRADASYEKKAHRVAVVGAGVQTELMKLTSSYQQVTEDDLIREEKE